MTFIKERYITVTDNWYPCYEGNKVRVELSLTPFLNKYYVSLAAWGADDTAYTKDFEYATEAEAKWQYNELIYSTTYKWSICREYLCTNCLRLYISLWNNKINKLCSW